MSGTRFEGFWRQRRDSILTGVVIAVIAVPLTTWVLSGLGILGTWILTKPFEQAVATNVASDDTFVAKVGERMALEVGTVVAWPGAGGSWPDNWRLCNGDPLPKKDHATLYERMKGTYGEGQDTFNLPDFRGYFLRGLDFRKEGDVPGREFVDPDASRRDEGIGSIQQDSVGKHGHELRGYPAANTYGNPTLDARLHFYSVPDGKEFQNSFPILENESDETRPVNIAVHWIIRVK